MGSPKFEHPCNKARHTCLFRQLQEVLVGIGGDAQCVQHKLPRLQQRQQLRQRRLSGQRPLRAIRDHQQLATVSRVRAALQHLRTRAHSWTHTGTVEHRKAQLKTHKGTDEYRNTAAVSAKDCSPTCLGIPVHLPVALPELRAGQQRGAHLQGGQDAAADAGGAVSAGG